MEYIARWVTVDADAVAGPRLPARALGAAALLEDALVFAGGLTPAGAAPPAVTNRLCLSDLAHVPHSHGGAFKSGGGGSRLTPALSALYWGSDSERNVFTLLVGNSSLLGGDPRLEAQLQPRPEEPHMLAHALVPSRRAGEAAAWVEVKTEWVHSGPDEGGAVALQLSAPPARTGAAFCCRKSRVFMFGGLAATLARQGSTGRGGGGGGGGTSQPRARYLSDIGYLSFASSTSALHGQWKSFSRPADGVDDWPAPRAHAAMIFIESKSPLVLLHGGEGAQGPLADTWICKLGARLEWTRVDVAGSPLRARVGGYISHLTAPGAPAAVLFGGRGRAGGSGGFSGGAPDGWDISVLALPRDASLGGAMLSVAALGDGAPEEGGWEHGSRGSAASGAAGGKRAALSTSASAASSAQLAFDAPPPMRWGAQCVCLDDSIDGALRRDPDSSKLGRILLERFRALGQLAAPHAANKRARGAAAAAAAHVDYSSKEWALDALASSRLFLVTGGMALPDGQLLADGMHVLCLIPTAQWPVTPMLPKPAGKVLPAGRFYEDAGGVIADGHDGNGGTGAVTVASAPPRPAVGLLAAGTAAAANGSRGAHPAKPGGGVNISASSSTTSASAAGAGGGQRIGQSFQQQQQQQQLDPNALMSQVKVLLQQLDAMLTTLGGGGSGGGGAYGGGHGGGGLYHGLTHPASSAAALSTGHHHHHQMHGDALAASVQPVVASAVGGAIDTIRSVISASVGALRSDLRGDLSRLEAEVAGSRSGLSRVDAALEALAAQRSRGEHSERERKDAAGRVLEALEALQAGQGGLAASLDKLRGELAGSDAKANEAIRAQTEAVARLAGATAELRSVKAECEQLRSEVGAASARAAAAEARLADRDARLSEVAAELGRERDDRKTALERAAAAEDRLRAVVEAVKR